MVSDAPAFKHLLDLLDVPTHVVQNILETAQLFKLDRARDSSSLRGRKLAMIFEQPSLRTRVSFEVAMLEMGGHALYLHPAEVGIGRRESVADVSRVLTSYVDGVVLRAFAHETVTEFAAHSAVPTINGLSNASHPCQGLTDAFTIQEIKPPGSRHIAYVGDGNAVAQALMLAVAHAGMSIRLACPEGYQPRAEYVAASRRIAAATGGAVELDVDPAAAVEGADVVYTDVWRSIGQELEYDRRLRVFQRYQVNDALLSRAKSDVVVMHDLPARRGEEISGDVLDGPRSIVQLQAQNRVPVQKAILAWCLGPQSSGGLA